MEGWAVHSGGVSGSVQYFAFPMYTAGHVLFNGTALTAGQNVNLFVSTVSTHPSASDYEWKSMPWQFENFVDLYGVAPGLYFIAASGTDAKYTDYLLTAKR